MRKHSSKYKRFVCVYGKHRRYIKKNVFNDSYPTSLLMFCQVYAWIVCHVRANFLRKFSSVGLSFQHKINANKMFAVITFETSREVKVIPIGWIKGFNLCATINDGINSAEKHVVFFSKNWQEQPNFFLPISDDSNNSNQSNKCYFARINKFFGE